MRSWKAGTEWLQCALPYGQYFSHPTWDSLVAPNKCLRMRAGSPDDNDMHIGIYPTNGYSIVNLV